MSETTEPAQEVLNNSLSTMAYSISFAGYGSQLSQLSTAQVNNRYQMITNNRNLLSQLYVEHGLVQTLVDQPVDDAFRAGYEIKSGQLGEDVEKLHAFLDRYGINQEIQYGVKWGRLYGGGALMLISEQDPEKPLALERITPQTRIAFRAVDCWELSDSKVYLNQSALLVNPEDASPTYDYYGRKVHKSRVFPIAGKRPPSAIKNQLRGWGMSEVEKVIRSFNQYIKNQDVVFELLDEAKIDIFKIKGFNSALATMKGTGQVTTRIQNANMIKSYINALTMDKDDEYEQKQINFAGLAEVLPQIRMGIAADLKMPVTKLFGVSAAGFSSGEDDIENYNSMVESEIRNKVKFIIIDVLRIICQHLFGYIPDDLMIAFKPLRVLSAEQEEKVKDARFARMLTTYQAGLATAQEAKQGFNKDSLLPVEVDETTDAIDMDTDDSGDNTGDDKE